MGDVYTRTNPVTSGVPQGTVLGPLLFLVYINDMPRCVHSSNTRLFADDCLIYKEIRTHQDAADLQSDLDALQRWEKAVAHELPSPEVLTSSDNEEEVFSRG